MTLRKRLNRLEAKREGNRPEPLVTLFRVTPAKGQVRVTGGNRRTPPAHFAVIGGGPHGQAATLRILERENEAAFLSRVQAETLRIHGRLPDTWKLA